jgi:hypothetical protein
MLATAPRLVIVWDEGYTLPRLDRVRAWLAALADPAGAASRWDPARFRPIEDSLPAPAATDVDTPAELFRPRILAWFWPFAREEPHGHPPFYAIVALLGDILAPAAPELLRARLGTMIAFSLATGGIFLFVARRWGTPAGVASAGAWLLHPHLFALGHYATYDGLLASLWVGATLAFAASADGENSRPRIDLAVLAGLLAASAFATKFTGWFLPVAWVAWSALQGRRGPWVALGIAAAIALPTLYLLTPPFWPDPVGGLARFLSSNLSRARTIPIRTMFLGTTYETPTGSLPWYNTLVWVALSTPILFLLFEVVGAARAVRRWRNEPSGLLLLLSASTVLVLRALPHTPGHDGTRQLAVGLGGLSVLAGPGLASAARHWPRVAHWLSPAAVLEGLISVLWMLPVPLSYYSPLVGGLPGATWLGMEPTYYWDALTDEALARLDAETPPGRTVLFAANPITWHYRETGRLRSGVFPFEGRDFAWYVVQNRPGAMSPIDRELARRAAGKDRRVLSSHTGVPLVWAFPAREVEAALRSVDAPPPTPGRPTR